jgi:hypothetical protein
MSEHTINSHTIGGTQIYCDWTIDKGYGTPSQVNPWKIALKQIFGTVEGEDYESLDWTDLDLDEYLERFKRIAGANYKTESIVAYGRRVRNALEAHRHYLETGRAPTTRPRKAKAEKPAAAEANGSVTPIKAKQQEKGVAPTGMVTFPYPLGTGEMASFTVPPRIKADDVNRICAFIRTLQDDSPERRQLPPGEDEQAA